MLVIVVVYRYYSWVGLVIASFPWELAWDFMILCKLDFREDAFRPDQIIQVLYPKCSMSSAIGSYRQPLKEALQGNINGLYCFGHLIWSISHLAYTDQALKRRFLMPGTLVRILVL